MLPRKRPVEIVEGENSDLKKHRVDCAVNSSSVTATSEGGSTNSGSGGKLSETEIGSRNRSVGRNMAFDDEKPQDIDEDLHSRQLAVYGRETMRRLFAANVLISGMQGLGAEIAKNLILAGVKSVTLHDEGVVELWDLSGNFNISESDVGKNRALASLQKLQELNNAVVVSTLTTNLTKDHLSGFQHGPWECLLNSVEACAIHVRGKKKSVFVVKLPFKAKHLIYYFSQ